MFQQILLSVAPQDRRHTSLTTSGRRRWTIRTLIEAHTHPLRHHAPGRACCTSRTCSQTPAPCIKWTSQLLELRIPPTPVDCCPPTPSPTSMLQRLLAVTPTSASRQSESTAVAAIHLADNNTAQSALTNPNSHPNTHLVPLLTRMLSAGHHPTGAYQPAGPRSLHHSLPSLD